jgi:hypothetical protein
MADNDAASRATEYWLALASSSGRGENSQPESQELKERDAETAAPRHTPRART